MKANITKFSYEENGFKIEIVRGHILVNDDRGSKVLIDTGSPLSFHSDGGLLEKVQLRLCHFYFLDFLQNNLKEAEGFSRGSTLHLEIIIIFVERSVIHLHLIFYRHEKWHYLGMILLKSL